MYTKKDLWIEMSIREIWTQCHFAEIAFQAINPIAGTDGVFSSIHAFLSHCALVSKLLMAKDDSNPPTIIGQILNVPEDSKIHDRTFRDHLDHYYDRLKRWIEKYPVNINIGTYNVGPKSAFSGNILFVSHYDPTTEVFTFVEEDLNLRDMYNVVAEIRVIADNWTMNLKRSAF